MTAGQPANRRQASQRRVACRGACRMAQDMSGHSRCRALMSPDRRDDAGLSKAGHAPYNTVLIDVYVNGILPANVHGDLHHH